MQDLIYAEYVSVLLKGNIKVSYEPNTFDHLFLIEGQNWAFIN